jgi:hypothetical protein
MSTSFHKSRLPDLIQTATGGIAARQPCTTSNVKAILDHLGLIVRRDAKVPGAILFVGFDEQLPMEFETAEQLLKDELKVLGIPIGDLTEVLFFLGGRT